MQHEKIASTARFSQQEDVNSSSNASSTLQTQLQMVETQLSEALLTVKLQADAMQEAQRREYEVSNNDMNVRTGRDICTRIKELRTNSIVDSARSPECASMST